VSNLSSTWSRRPLSGLAALALGWALVPAPPAAADSVSACTLAALWASTAGSGHPHGQCAFQHLRFQGKSLGL